MNVFDHLQTRLQDHQAQLKALSARNSQFVTLRIISFLAGVIWLIWAINDSEFIAAPYISIGFFLLFFIILNKDKANQNKMRLTRNLVEIDEEEIRRLKGDLTNLESGEGFQDPQHPFAQDLDLFGNHSLFQNINRNNLEGSEKLLANWLKNPVSKQEAEQRQEGIKELLEQEVWRTDFQSKMRLLKDTKGKVDFLSGDPQPYLYLITAMILGVVTLAIMIAAVTNNLAPGYAWLAVITNSVVFVGRLQFQNPAKSGPNKSTPKLLAGVFT